MRRSSELDRLFDEYLAEAAQRLDVPRIVVSDDIRMSVLTSVTSLSDLEKAAMRLVALKSAPNLYQAARLLHIAPVSLSRWFHRRAWNATPR